MQNTNKQFGVVFVQMHVTDNKLQNIQLAEKLIRAAYLKYQPKLVVLPEYFNTKWGKQYFEQYAEVFPTGETYVALSKLAKELQIYLVGGSIPERDAKTNYLFNTAAVFGPAGQLLTKYRKIHLFNGELPEVHYPLLEAEYFQPGTELAYFEVEGGVKIGLGIGYDINFAEISQLYRQQGVEMIIFPAAFPASFGYAQWELLNKARAIDNQLYVLGVAQARFDAYAPELVHYGRSLLVDYAGKVIARAGDEEEFVYAYLNFAELEQYREKFALFAQKRNDVYETVYKF